MIAPDCLKNKAAGISKKNGLPVTALTAVVPGNPAFSVRDPWLSAPASRRVCLYDF